MSKGKVLQICSTATEIEIHGGAGKTGHYLNETVVPVLALIEAGYEVVLATPNGKKPHIDEVSDSVTHFGGDEKAYQQALRFFARDATTNQIRTLRSVIDEGLGGYVAVFIPGGQAPVVDLMQNEEVGEILRYFHDHKRPTALLCHGPISSIAALPNAKDFRAALVSGEKAKAAKLAKGWQYAGYKMTVFSNTEEEVIEDRILHGTLYFNMVDALTLAGAEVSTNPTDFEPYVVEDRELITGQNPRSDHPIAAKLIAALERARSTR